MSMKNHMFKCSTAVVIIQNEFEDDAWVMLEELVGADNIDDFELVDLSLLNLCVDEILSII